MIIPETGKTNPVLLNIYETPLQHSMTLPFSTGRVSDIVLVANCQLLNQGQDTHTCFFTLQNTALCEDMSPDRTFTDSYNDQVLL